MSAKATQSKKALLIVGIAIVIAVALIFAFTRPEAKPEPSVSWNGHETFEGTKRLYLINVTVGNKGAPGYIRVFASVDSSYQEELIYLNSGELRTLHFVFDISSLDPIAPLVSSAGAEAA